MGKYDPISSHHCSARLQPSEQRNILNDLPHPFTMRDLAAAIARHTPDWMAGRETQLAEEALSAWGKRRAIKEHGTISGLLAYRRTL